MASIISGITFITLIATLLSPLPIISAILDTDGDSLINSGAAYYILPKGDGGNLALTEKAGEPPCPNFITRKPDSQPIPARLSNPLRILILPSRGNSIEFNATLTTCTAPQGWRVNTDSTTGKLYVVSDGAETTSLNYAFSIDEAAESGADEKVAYKISSCSRDEEGKCGYLGFFEEDGLMGITNENPLVVEFEKVNENNSGLSHDQMI